MSEHNESQHLAVIRVWAALAWADGVIQESERAAISRLISVAKLSEADKSAAMAMLDSQVEAEMARVAELSQPAREGIYRAALRLAMVDMDMAAEEAHFLQRLREGLELSDDEAARIEKSISSV